MAFGIVLPGFLPHPNPGKVNLLKEELFLRYTRSGSINIDATDMQIRGDKSEIIDFLHRNKAVRLRGSGSYYVRCADFASWNQAYKPVSISTPLASAVVKGPKILVGITTAIGRQIAASGLDPTADNFGQQLELAGRAVGPSSRGSRLADYFRSSKVVSVSVRAKGYDDEICVAISSLTGLLKLADITL